MICVITISYKISSKAILFKLPDKVCVQTKLVGDNKEVNKIYSCCVLLTSPCVKKIKKIKKLNERHSFSLFQEENIPWSICVLLTSPLIKISLLNTN